MPAQRAYDGNALARPSSRHQGGLKPMVKFEISTHINRPVAEVFKYMSDPTKLPEWNSVVEEATPSETPVRVGTKIQVRARFLGRKIDSPSVVTEYEVNKRYTNKSERPFALTITNTFETEGGGTKVGAIFDGDAAGFFKLDEWFKHEAIRQWRRTSGRGRDCTERRSQLEEQAGEAPKEQLLVLAHGVEP